jgi:tRNA 2-thiouridine synthesizing protein A
MKKEILDATGLLCPLPVLKLRKHLKSMDNGNLITVLADDPAAAIDIPHFCNEAGHKLVSKTNSENGVKEYTVKKIN